ncbi:deoxynucleoside kinase [Brevibacillus daliensis]|uniref:deoxynucleoside kinase n=1 Tax=Brevibacillus daliensis TaxID=2892995 RepID=UPI001E5704A7|nr:deoxynucleoside kinase [Brevibacillus daliensis]
MDSIFITVEGPIGVGKTSLSEIISRTYDLQLMGEIVYENPFLDKFYTDIAEWSFQLEMFFLCNRYKQLQEISGQITTGNSVVSDYNIFKNTIFARRTLDEETLAKYLQIYNILTKDMPQAQLVIYLKASLETVMKRIAMRGRGFEKQIDESYMVNLIADYEDFMREFERCHPEIPVLTIECDELDYVHRKEDLEKVLERIKPFLPVQLTSRG